MKTRELQDRVRFIKTGYGTFKVTIEYKGQEYSCTTHNTLAIDRINGSDDWGSDLEIHCGYTLKQAYMALWDECKRANDIGVQHYAYKKA
jgi:hypothetical protein